MAKKNTKKKKKSNNKQQSVNIVNNNVSKETVNSVNNSVSKNTSGFKEKIIKLDIEKEEDIESKDSQVEIVTDNFYNEKLGKRLRVFNKKIASVTKPFRDKVVKLCSPVTTKASKVCRPVCNKISKGFHIVTKKIVKFFEPLTKMIKSAWNSERVRPFRVWCSKKSIIIKKRTLVIQNFIFEKPFKTSLILAFIDLIVIESLSRRSFTDAIVFMCDKPLIFLFNYLIVLTPFLIAIAVRRRIVVYALFFILWILIGVTDFYLLSNRTTPFTGVDLKIDTNEISVIFEYLNEVETVLISAALILAVLGIIFLFIFSKKAVCKYGRFKSMIIVAIDWVIIYFAIILGINSGVLTMKFGNLGISYHDYGMPYCFLITIVDTGIAKPKDYSEEKMDNLVNTPEPEEIIVEEEEKTKDISELPNIIFIQLESFIDPTLINNGVQFSEDPMPFYRSLREKYSSGYLTVPTVVAGTCNTEFEVITGMSLEFFGPGEYPYKTILKQTTCESMAYDLKELGYTAHAMHNHTSGFYGRNEIYANFGFDTFTGIEMMHDYTRTASGNWAKDDVLQGCIMDCLNSSESKDLVYTVSVQCHGTYNVDLPEEEKVIGVTGIEDEELLRAYIYYVNQVKQVDNFIQELVTELSLYDEPTVLVMYGDHIPGLNLADSMFKDKTIYETEYVIWDNMGLEKQDESLTSYQIASEVFDRVGIHDGTIFKYHQQSEYDSAEYLTNLEYLQYDMLYGQHYVYNGENPYVTTDIQYGVKDIVIEEATYDGEYLYVSSANKCFSKYSKLFINGDRKKTELLFSDLIRVKVNPEDIPDGTILTVHQINSLDKEFHCSPEYVYTNGEYTFDEEVYEGIFEEVEEDTEADEDAADGNHADINDETDNNNH